MLNNKIMLSILTCLRKIFLSENLYFLSWCGNYKITKRYLEQRIYPQRWCHNVRPHFQIISITLLRKIGKTALSVQSFTKLL